MAGIIVVDTVCPECKQSRRVACPAEGYDAWRKGALIQRAMPQLTAADRERLLTGYCPKCWDELFPPDEDETTDEEEA